MKGIVFNTLEEVICEEDGLEEWESLLAETKLDGVYSSIGSYPDEQFAKLVTFYAARKNMTVNEGLRWYGKKAFPHFARKFDQHVSRYKHAKTFLLTLNDIIHPEVRKLYPGASVPFFEYREPDGNTLEIVYSSPKKLCKFAEGLIEGAAEHYKTPVHISQTRCMLKGDAHCHIHCAF